MESNQFADLDELTQRCHDPKAKTYFAEALASYRSGALRAAIISTWIAVAFDFIDKVRQLDLQGEPKAKQYAQELDQIQTNHDVNRSLAFERTILDRAHKDLELINAVEHKELTRLYEDRHLCAHPSMNASGELFQPTPEQVRYHMRTAVDTLLSQPPTAGKASLISLTGQVEGAFFPDDREKAKLILNKGPLAKPKPSLVRNFTIVLVKKMLDPTVDRPARLRAAAALNALKQMHPMACNGALEEKLVVLLRAQPDENYGRAIALVARVDDTAALLEQDVITRMEQYISNASVPVLAMVVKTAAIIPLLSSVLDQRLKSLVASDLVTIASASITTVFTRPVLKERSRQLYLDSKSYDQANILANSLIIPLAASLTQSEVEALARGAFKNSEIRGSFQFLPVLRALRGNSQVPHNWWDSLMTELGAKEQFDELFFTKPSPNAPAQSDTGDEEDPPF